MNTRTFPEIGVTSSLLGFGAMRMPIIGGNHSHINEEEAIKLIRYAIDGGVSYLDTAYVYHMGKSEALVGKALKDGYREKILLATKSPTWNVRVEDDWHRLLDKQLSRMEVDYFDFYLQHGIDKEKFEHLKKFNFFEKAMEAKKAGKIKYFGFSFHDSHEVFMEILNSYDWDFCQIQLNYIDENFQAGIKGLEAAAAKNIGVVVMEPLRGGTLTVGLPDSITKKMASHETNRSPVEWSFRWLANLPGVTVILSGMSTIEQVKENIDICSKDNVCVNCMTEKDFEFISTIVDDWYKNILIPCTNCGYCMPCPNGVDIPRCFKSYNYCSSDNEDAIPRAKDDYLGFTRDFGTGAEHCVECGACEDVCPQSLPIMEKLKELHEFLKI